MIRAGTVTGIGSLPHVDAGDAALFSLRVAPDLPAAPQLPRRDPAEGMLAQAVAGIPGVAVDADARVRVDRDRFGPPAEMSMEGSGFTGFTTFLDALAAVSWTGPVKLQHTGPLTLALALEAAGVPIREAILVASAAASARIKAMVTATADAVPAAPLVVFVDEPGLVSITRRVFPLDAVEVADLISGALAAGGPQVTSGLHCCGATDWRVALAAGPDILSLPVDEDLLSVAGALAGFLGAGGRIAWGAVPTDGPLGESADGPWRRLATLWCDLTRAGCDPALLRTNALITPACGLAGHGVSQAERVFDVATVIGRRVEDQAIATRLTVGA